MTRPFARRADRRRSGRRAGGDHRAGTDPHGVSMGPTPLRRIPPPRRAESTEKPTEGPAEQPAPASRRHAAPGGTRRRPWAWLAAGTVLGLLLGLGVATVATTGPDGVRLGQAGLVIGAPPAAAPPAAGSRGTWGQRITTPDGIAIEVAAPVPFEPSPQAAGHDRGRAVLVTTTVVNGSDTPFAVNTFAFGPTATHRDRVAARIFDVAGSLVPAVPVTTVAPGTTLTYRTAFSLDRTTGPLTLRYEPEGHEPGAVFTGDA